MHVQVNEPLGPCYVHVLLNLVKISECPYLCCLSGRLGDLQNRRKDQLVILKSGCSCLLEQLFTGAVAYESS